MVQTWATPICNLPSPVCARTQSHIGSDTEPQPGRAFGDNVNGVRTVVYRWLSCLCAVPWVPDAARVACGAVSDAGGSQPSL